MRRSLSKSTPPKTLAQVLAILKVPEACMAATVLPFNSSSELGPSLRAKMPASVPVETMPMISIGAPLMCILANESQVPTPIWKLPLRKSA